MINLKDLKWFLRLCSLFVLLIWLAGCLGNNFQAPRSAMMGSEVLPVRDYLVGTEKEEKGYGLYSYLLFGSAPDKTSRARYKKVVETYLAMVSAGDMEEQGVPTYRMNITYLFFREAPPPEVQKCLDGQCIDEHNKQIKETIDWILAHYNYARAAALLSRVSGKSGRGPYIFSNAIPFSYKGDLSAYVFQDLSSVHIDVIKPWVQEFLAYSEKESFGTKKDIKRLALHLINHIKIISSDLPKVKRAVEDWIEWLAPIG